MFSLKSKTMYVAGGVGLIGAAIARASAYAGAKVIILDINAASGRKLETEIRKKGGIAHFASFDITVCGTDVANGKPHPEPYQKALKGLGVNKSQAIVIENAPFGIRSAKAAGLKCFALETSLPKQFLSQADKVFFSYNHMHENVNFRRMT